MGLLKIISRSSNRTSKQPDHDWPDDEDDPLALANTPFISRPPPLDTRTEQELRKACAIILADLKPSGYDIEDTRMKSDALVDARERDGGSYSQHLAQKAKRSQAHAHAAAPITALPDPSATLAPTSRPRRDQDEQKRVDSVRLSSNTQAQIASLMAPLEGPLAPTSTQVPEASPVASAPPQSAAGRRIGSVASSVSTHVTSPSMGQSGIVSTNATSAIPSNRVSDMAALHTSPHANSYKSPELSVSPMTTNKAAAEAAAAASAASAAAAATVPRTSALNPRNEQRPSSKRGYSVSSIHSTRAESVYSDSERGSSRQPSDAGRNGVAPLKIDKDAPPVPRMDAARMDGSRPFARQESASTSRPQTATKQPSHGILKHHKESSVAQEFWKPVAARNGTIRADGSRTDPRAGDFDSLMPKDKEAQALAAQSQQQSVQPPTVASSSRMPPAVVSAVGNHVSSPSRGSISSAASRTRGPQIHIPSRTSSITAQTQLPNGLGRVTSQPSQAASVRAGSLVSSPRSAMFALENGMGHAVAHRTVTAQAKADQGPNGTASPRSPVDIVYHAASPDMMQGGRLSHAGSMHGGVAYASSVARERRGFKKILSKLGGSEVQTKKIYVPPSYHPHNNYMQAGYPDDYWSDDDEVCAAPVVAFGRGW